MEKSEFELAVSPGRQPIYFLVLAAIFFTALLYLLYDAVLTYMKFGFEMGSASFALYSTDKIVMCIVLGIRFSMTKDVLIDTDTHSLISRYRVGPITRDVRSKCPNLEYISVFRNQKDMFEVNLWYKTNRHYKMYEFEEKDHAFELAKIAAAKLKIDLLDATVHGDSKWIDTPTLTQ